MDLASALQLTHTDEKRATSVPMTLSVLPLGACSLGIVAGEHPSNFSWIRRLILIHNSVSLNVGYVVSGPPDLHYKRPDTPLEPEERPYNLL